MIQWRIGTEMLPIDPILLPFAIEFHIINRLVFIQCAVVPLCNGALLRYCLIFLIYHFPFPPPFILPTYVDLFIYHPVSLIPTDLVYEYITSDVRSSSLVNPIVMPLIPVGSTTQETYLKNSLVPELAADL
jgi:hypothetical protein